MGRLNGYRVERYSRRVDVAVEPAGLAQAEATGLARPFVRRRYSISSRAVRRPRHWPDHFALTVQVHPAWPTLLWPVAGVTPRGQGALAGD